MKAEVKATSKNDTKVEVDIRGHSLVIDEPEQHGGSDDGPNPVEYELASLTGCLNVVANVVAQQRDVEIKSMELNASGELDPEKFQKGTGDERAGFQMINVEIDIETDVSREEEAELIEEVERRCPVSDNLSNQTPVSVELN